ncbi:MAG: hypothetical protein FD166_1839 [Bacteroidetes bacterium]|nr:MAG: hypothetical protein FD166_1839 [Bacteroidota bacterium]
MSPRRTFVEQGISITSSDAPKISIYTYFEVPGVQFAYLCCNFHPRKGEGIRLNRISELISKGGFYRYLPFNRPSVIQQGRIAEAGRTDS